jgi:DNA-binding response OmpR family regulator
MALAIKGHEVRVASGIADGLQRCAVFEPDVVIVEVGMSYDALEFIRTLRGRGARPKIIALTVGGSHNDAGVLSKVKEAGADVALRKPAPTNLLVATVETLLTT